MWSKWSIKYPRAEARCRGVAPARRRGTAAGAPPIGAGHHSGRSFRAVEAEPDMARVGRLIVMAGTLAASCGCAGGGWYRAIGNLPGVAWTDYAFTFYCD